MDLERKTSPWTRSYTKVITAAEVIVMQKTLTAIGNSLGIVIEKPILALLGISKDTPLEMTTDGERLIITPVKSARAKRLRAASQRAMKNHEGTLRRLAK
jgi:antitoxin component of MazEF toxin-antitoxin module